MVKIEVLYPEICNLYGELANVKYLKRAIKKCEVIETNLNEKPKFVSEDIDILYMAPMTEANQEVVIEQLKPYKNDLQQFIEKGKLAFFTNNAVEILGNYIENEDGSRVEALKILDIYAKRDMLNRANTLFLGEFEGTKIVGFKDQFTMVYGNNEENYLFKVTKGWGLNKESKLEGIRVNNLFASYVLGPILPLNPDFAKYILELLGQEAELPFEEEAKTAYEIRLKEFEDNNTKFE